MDCKQIKHPSRHLRAKSVRAGKKLRHSMPGARMHRGMANAPRSGAVGKYPKAVESSKERGRDARGTLRRGQFSVYSQIYSAEKSPHFGHCQRAKKSFPGQPLGYWVSVGSI